MTLSSHQRGHRGATDIWLTPPWIIDALAPFDLDPCAAVGQPWKTAKTQWTEEVFDGLSTSWASFGLVWLNPPFGPDAGMWFKRLADHGNGIGLCAARTETRWFCAQIWDRADGILFLRGRPHFHHPDGTRGSANSGAPICLAAYGTEAVKRLGLSGIPGAMVQDWEVT